MSQTRTETVTTRDDASGRIINTSSPGASSIFQTMEYLVYFGFGILEALLTLRFFFELLGANLGSSFVSSIYSISNGFVQPFQGIFGAPSAPAFGTTLVFEPATIVALLVYGFVASALVMLFRALSGSRQAGSLY